MAGLGPTDLLTPRGRLNGAALWPRARGETRPANAARIRQTLIAYLEEADGKTAALVGSDYESQRDEARKRWAEYRAYDEVYQVRVMMPTTVETPEQGSSSYLVTQLQLLAELRDQALAEFNAIVDQLDVDVATTVPLTRESYSAPTIHRF
jgi:hypothetical protein